VLAVTTRIRCERSVVAAGGDSKKRYVAKKMTRRVIETATLAAVSSDRRRLRRTLRKTNLRRGIKLSHETTGYTTD
jgi:hypothetical protein